MLQIRMSTEIEERVGNLLSSSNGTNLVENNSSSSSGAATSQSQNMDLNKRASVPEIDTVSEKLNIELKQKQDKMRVYDLIS